MLPDGWRVALHPGWRPRQRHRLPEQRERADMGRLDRRLRREVPGKNFIPGPTDNCFCAECRFMKMNTLEKLHDALLNLQPEIILPEAIRARAEMPLRRMLEWSA